MTEMLHSTPSLHQVLSGPWLAALPLPVLALDQHGLILGANLPAAQLLGISTDELQGQAFGTTAVAADHEGGFADLFGHVLAGSTWSGPLPLRTAPEAHLQVS